MPGKVNPVIPEVVNMVCFRVIGSDLTVTMAAEAGQLQLNVFEPVIAACIFEAQTMFINAARTLREHCVEGITANRDVCAHYVDFSIGTVTALNPVIGYDRSTELAAEAMRTGKGILELVREHGLLTEAQIAEVLDPLAMTGPQGAEQWSSPGAAGVGSPACVAGRSCARRRSPRQRAQPRRRRRLAAPSRRRWSATGERHTLPAEDGRHCRRRAPLGRARAHDRRRAAPRLPRGGHRLRRRAAAPASAAPCGPTIAATGSSARWPAMPATAGRRVVGDDHRRHGPLRRR